MAAPAAKLGEARGPGLAREAARDARFCEFCRRGAEEGCGRGGGRGGGGRGGVMMVLNVAALLPGELPERRVRSPADSACSAPDARHRGQEPFTQASPAEFWKTAAFLLVLLPFVFTPESTNSLHHFLLSPWIGMTLWLEAKS